MTYSYPPARRDDTVDDFFGTPVADPYRWMEDPALPEVRTFIDEQNEIAREFLETSLRVAVKERLQNLYKYAHVPSWRQLMRRGDSYFSATTSGRIKQS